jgi:CBS domain-containing protein
VTPILQEPDMTIDDVFGATAEDDTVDARTLMSAPVLTLGRDVSVLNAAEAMLRTGFTTVPAVDERGRLIKLVTEDAVARAYLVQSWADRGPSDEKALLEERGGRVIDFAAPPISVEPDASLTEVAETMLRAQLRAVPVVERHRPIGIVTWRDILAAIVARSPTRSNPR